MHGLLLKIRGQEDNEDPQKMQNIFVCFNLRQEIFSDGFICRSKFAWVVPTVVKIHCVKQV